MPRAVWSHKTTVCRASNFSPFWLFFGAEVVPPEEIKHQSLCTTAEAPPCPNEAKEKDLLESERLKTVTNLQKYPDETRIWRGPKVTKRDFDMGNLVLLWSPRTESSGKLKSKWEGPYMIIKKTRPYMIIEKTSDEKGATPNVQGNQKSGTIRSLKLASPN
jgi:hypothetical protein